MAKFKNIEQILEVLKNAYYLERDYELLSESKASLEIPEEWKRLVLTLALDSKEHSIILRELLKGFKVDIISEPKQTKIKFSFSGISNDEIFRELMQIEEQMERIYVDIFNNTSYDLIKDNFSYPSELFFWVMKSLAKAEREHKNMIESNYSHFKL